MHGIWIDVVADLAGDVGLARKLQAQGPEGRLQAFVGDVGRERGDQRRAHGHGFLPGRAGGCRDQRGHHDALQRLPAIEGILVVSRKEQEIAFVQIALERDGRGEAAQQRGNGPLGQAAEYHGLYRGADVEHVAGRVGTGDRCGRELLAVLAHEADADRDEHRLLVGLPGRGRKLLAEGEGEAAGFLLVGAVDLEHRGSGLFVPQGELLEIEPARLLETGEECLDRRCLSVVTAEVEIHAGPESLVADEALEHAHDLGALLVDGGRVEVVDLVIEARAHRMGEGAGILGKLVRLQQPDVGDALDRTRAHVGRKLLVAEDCQPFLQAELEPVAAGDAIARPVVEVLVGDDGLDAGIVLVGCRLRAGQDVFVVEDVEALVLHRAHVEVGHGDDVEHVEIVGAAEDLFVPAHGALQAVHRPVAGTFVAVLDIDVEGDIAAFAGPETVADARKVACHHGEEVGGLGMRIVPDGVVTVGSRHRTAFHRIAVAQQDRRLAGASLDPGGVNGEAIGAVEEISDPPEAFSLALGAVGAVRAIKTHQLGVRVRVERRLDLQRERAGGRRDDFQPVGRDRVVAIRQHAAVEREGGQAEVVAVEHQRRSRCRIARPLQRQACPNLCRAGREANVEMDRGDPVSRRPIVFEADGSGRVGAHEISFLRLRCDGSFPLFGRTGPAALTRVIGTSASVLRRVGPDVQQIDRAISTRRKVMSLSGSASGAMTVKWLSWPRMSSSVRTPPRCQTSTITRD